MAYKQNTRPDSSVRLDDHLCPLGPALSGESVKCARWKFVRPRKRLSWRCRGAPVGCMLWKRPTWNMEHGPCDVVAQALWRMHPRDGKNKKDKPLRLSGLLRRLLGDRASLPSGAPAAAIASVQRKGELARADRRKLYI